MLLMFVSLAVLWSAPLLYELANRYTRAHKIVERVIVIALSLLVIFAILPESFHAIGWWAIVMAGVGMLLPSFLERSWHGMAKTVHWVPVMFGCLGLALHASLDGAAFVQPEHFREHHHFLPLGVVGHRLFEGLFIWWALAPRFSRFTAALVLAFITLFTCVGFAAGTMYFHTVEGLAFFDWFQALVAGSLLHLAIDRHDIRHCETHHGDCVEDHEHGHGHSHSHSHDHAHQHDDDVGQMQRGATDEPLPGSPRAT